MSATIRIAGRLEATVASGRWTVSAADSRPQADAAWLKLLRGLHPPGGVSPSVPNPDGHLAERAAAAIRARGTAVEIVAAGEAAYEPGRVN